MTRARSTRSARRSKLGVRRLLPDVDAGVDRVAVDRLELLGGELDVAYEVGEGSTAAEEEIAHTEEEFVSLFKDTFDAEELEEQP